MFAYLANERKLLRKFDKEKGTRNCWNFCWPGKTVNITWKQREKEKTLGGERSVDDITFERKLYNGEKIEERTLQDCI